MVFKITPAHDPSVFLDFEIPGKGTAKPLTFKLPKLQYLPAEAYTEYRTWLKEHEADKYLATHDINLKLLAVAAPKHVAAFEKLTRGEIEEIQRVWSEQSKVTPGESEASATS
jgi:hypothetical protein